LSCANCAAKIEESVKALDGVSYASLAFITASLRVEAAGLNSEDLLGEIAAIVLKYEPDASVLERANFESAFKEDKEKNRIIWLVAGAAALAVGVLLEHLSGVDGYLRLAVFVFGYLLLGFKVLLRAAKNMTKGNVFDENFLMAIATAGAFAIGEYAEAVGVMLFYQVGEFFQDMAVSSSKRNIARLMDIRPDYANLRTDGAIESVAPETVHIGAEIIVKPGERIPIDGVVIEGESFLDMSALTGESVPQRASVSDTVLSGSVNQSGLLAIRTTKTFGQSTASKIIDLVENAADKKAATENFITKFARYYTPVVVAFACLIAVVPPLLFGGLWTEWLNRGLVFLVISCPCALVISIPLSYFGGIGRASKKGILVKGGNYLEALSDIDIAVFDKTGTLTEGVFKVTDILPSDGFGAEELLRAAASAEAFSNHPIALSILRAHGGRIEKNSLSQYTELAGHGVSVNADGRTILAGNKQLMDKEAVVFKETEGEGTKVYVASDGLYMGCIVISDRIKNDSRAAIAGLKALGTRKTVMLTGDNSQTANAVGCELKIDEVHSGLLPQQKVEMVQTLGRQKQGNGKLVFVGDGINDAPVLALADVGVAMGGLGSDAAIEAADVVLMTDEPSKLVEAVGVARFTKRIVWQNIIFAIGVKSLFLLLGAFGAASMWEAVFADVGVAVLVVVNSMRLLRR
ncbi:MAG: cadmium-translocating P-type ATPase, partial [Oscillospiraceae bacterium]|nr:cadmium-translocating P-type ATPase [Oscillospiraceae bacterium]